ncbi:hypothetical protein [Kyrpidia sp.]|uniref:DUF6922 domain-containing protein n=1 Tax=Kyrpidia sp. TaxID=2073077 RepID=UPI002586AC4C|nr:hypothetical protein [Kyrpidia sp.]MCL6577106.1 hypothetical protein [Kyrpidia sp.]
MAIPRKLPEFLWPLFHNYVPESIDPERDWKFVIHTVMQAGTWEQVEWAALTYGRERFEQVLREDLEGNQELARPVANFWSIALWGKPIPPLKKGERWRPTRKVPGV